MSSLADSIISIRGVRKVYRQGKLNVEALRGVDLEVPRGEFLSIVGPPVPASPPCSISLADLLLQRRARCGRRHDVSQVGDAGRTALRRKSVSFVFQNFNLLPNLSAGDNIRTAMYLSGAKSLAMDGPTRELLKLLGIEGRLDHKPSELSGGEQQRVAIARALATNPAILLADEPTGNLDSKNSDAVLGVLRDLNQRFGQTILMITHNPDAAAYGHRTVHMSDGRIVETSTVGNQSPVL